MIPNLTEIAFLRFHKEYRGTLGTRHNPRNNLEPSISLDSDTSEDSKKDPCSAVLTSFNTLLLEASCREPLCLELVWRARARRDGEGRGDVVSKRASQTLESKG